MPVNTNDAAWWLGETYWANGYRFGRITCDSNCRGCLWGKYCEGHGSYCGVFDLFDDFLIDLRNEAETWLKAKSGAGFLSIGMDPEFEFIQNGRIVSANRTWRSITCSKGDIGIDGSGHQIELRPIPSKSPEGLLKNVRSLLEDFITDERDLGINGGRYPLGAHIHFGLVNPKTCVTNVFREDIKTFTSILDWALGGLVLPLSGRSRKSFRYSDSYYRLKNSRINEHGFEYRVLPSSIFASEDVLYVILKICYDLANSFFNSELGVTIKYNEIDDNMAPLSRLKRLCKLSSSEVKCLEDFVYSYGKMKKKISAAWRIPNVKKDASTERRTYGLNRNSRSTYFKNGMVLRLYDSIDPGGAWAFNMAEIISSCDFSALGISVDNNTSFGLFRCLEGDFYNLRAVGLVKDEYLDFDNCIEGPFSPYADFNEIDNSFINMGIMGIGVTNDFLTMAFDLTEEEKAALKKTIENLVTTVVMRRELTV